MTKHITFHQCIIGISAERVVMAITIKHTSNSRNRYTLDINYDLKHGTFENSRAGYC